MTINDDMINRWANDPAGPTALLLKQRLEPVEGGEGPVYPPTYADIGYSIDELADGTKIAQIDSIGSQANRMEPLFKKSPLATLVPQIAIQVNDDTIHSLFDYAHRAGDAVVRSAPDLNLMISDAFAALKRTGNALPLAAIAPTSLLFGVWDSRGESQEKIPRLVRSVIRAHDVEVLHAAAQFNSIWKQLDEHQRDEMEKEAKRQKTELSEKGFKDAPATFRKTKLPQMHDGRFNQEARVLGGVLVHGSIERTVLINLVALRSICADKPESSETLRRYILSLALAVASEELDLYLREGCLLKYADERDTWFEVPRRGANQPVDLAGARDTILASAASAAETLKPLWPDKRTFSFDMNEAKRLLAKKDVEVED